VLRRSSPHRGSSYRLTLPLRRSNGASRLPSPAARKMRLTDFCNRFSTRAPAERPILEVSDALARCASRATEPKPQRTTRVKAHLTLRSQLRKILTRTPRRSDVGFERRTFLVGSFDRRTRVRRPTATAFSAADGECESSSDAPCRRAPPRPKAPGCDPTRTASAATSSKATASTIQSAFPRRVLARRRFHGTSNASPPPVPGLCHPGRASDALSPPGIPEG
jgi:hypothetical protein